MLDVVVDYPTPFEGWGMVKNHGATEAGKLPKAWTRGRERVSGAESP